MNTADEQLQIVADSELDYKEVTLDIVAKAQADSIKANDTLRKMMTEEILPLFKKINGCVLSLVVLTMIIDTWLVHAGLIKAEQRLINSEVIMSLIGASTVQLGAIMFTISAYLFPKK